jgi:divalent metal cation (Fe/Co/Zn/Cd) transporter
VSADASASLPPPVAFVDRRALLGRAIRLEQATIGWNVVEGCVALGAGWMAGSIALVGFGLDSAIESVSAATVLHHLRAEAGGQGEREADAGERRSLRVVGVTFFLLSAYVLYQAVTTLWRRDRPEESALGIALACVSLTLMPILGWLKLRTGRTLACRALLADAKETFACAYLSFTLLAGLALNALFGWWWADPVAALAMLPFVLHEGWEALRESREGFDGD